MSKASPVVLLSLVVLGVALYVPGFGYRDLWNPDEPRYAEVAREMRVLGDFVVPHLNGEVYAEKPPLFFWLAALLQSIGIHPHGGAVVAAAAGVGIGILTFLLGRLWLSLRGAVLSAVVFLTFELSRETGAFGVMDSTLTVFTTLAVYGFLRYRESHGRGWWFLLYAALAAAVLSKGPVGVLVVLVAILGFGGGRELLHWRHAGGVAFTLALIALWVVPACLQAGPEYANTILLKQNMGRVYQSWAHDNAWFYYLAVTPGNAAPWTLFIPAAFVWAFRAGRLGKRSELRGLFWWSVAGVLVFSAISGKRDQYVFPLYPGMALILGAYFDERVARAPGSAGTPQPGRTLLLLHHSLALVVGILLALVGLTAGWLEPHLVALAARVFDRIPEPEIATHLALVLATPVRLGLVAGAILLTAIAVFALRQTAKRELLSAVVMIALQMLVVCAVADLVLAKPINHFKSPRPVAERMNELAASGGSVRVASYPHIYRGGFNLYAERTAIEVIETGEDLQRFLSNEGPRLVLTTQRFYEGTNPPLTARHRVIPAGRVGRRAMVFLVNY